MAGVADFERALAHAEASGDLARRRRVIGTLLTEVVNGPTLHRRGDRPLCSSCCARRDLTAYWKAVLKRFLGLFYAMAARPDEALELIRARAVPSSTS